MDPEFERLATGRAESLFTDDLEANRAALLSVLRNSRIAVVGAAGSVGSAVVKTIIRYTPRALTLIDLSENNLVEVVRDLRSDTSVTLPLEFTTLPIGMGSTEFSRYFAETAAFDFLLNLSAIKHVRTERDVYCLIRMLDTNVVSMHNFLEANPYMFRKVFSVSSDKATNPANLMGASKLLMERALLARSHIQPFSTARFANVAFSDGSLPFGFLRRMAKRQPLSAPSDVRRYFISHLEAGELCVLSCALGDNRNVFFPKLSAGIHEVTFEEIARRLLSARGYEPCVCESEEEAKRRVDELIRQKKWPCYFFKSDTTGEKPYEEFFAEGERLLLDRFKQVGIVQQDTGNAAELDRFLSFFAVAKTDPRVQKIDYVREIMRLVPSFQHKETGRNLDQKM